MLAGLLTLAACGSDGNESAGSPDTTPASETTSVPAVSDSALESDATAASESGDPSAPADASTTSPDKPAVELPAELPTELQVTELRAGSGPEAASGDLVVVHYVGVRSEDGTEFDNSWDRGSPFTVVLGTGSVIAGWDQGLVGTQAGGRYQLDIPAELGYGDAGAGDIIQPGDALSFVIDVLAVGSPSAAEDQPEITSDVTSEGATEVTFDDLVVGSGEAAAEGDSVLIDLIAFRGDTGEQVDSTWGTGGPFALVLAQDQALPGLVEGIVGMQPGGRRLIRIPSELAFGTEGSPDAGIPAGVDLVVVIDLTAAY
ncbi:MAG: FKBP-type peptidyl-prolyl cis-trans isomerase [Ilumatobacteraceae bacterium]